MKPVKILISNWFLCTILTLAILWALLAGFLPLQFLDFKVYDFMARLRGHNGESSPVVIVAIDEKSLDTIGDWPWPRSHIAKIIRCLSESGAKALGIHLLYTHKELNAGLEEICSLNHNILGEGIIRNQQTRKRIETILKQSERDFDHDAQLIAAVRAATNVVLPFRFREGPDERGTTAEISDWLWMNSLDLRREKTGRHEAMFRLWSVYEVFERDQITAANAPTSPFKDLSTKAKGLGHTNLCLDPDGVARSVPLFIRYRDRYFPSFSLQIALKFLQEDIRSVVLRDELFGFVGLSFNSLKIPTDRFCRMLIDYSRNCCFHTFSASDVLTGHIPADAFDGKIVLLGISAAGVGPLYNTPLYPSVPDLHITAQAVGNIVRHRHLSRPVWAPYLEMLILLYIGLFLLFVIPKVNPRIGGLILGIFAATWLGLTLLFFLVAGCWLKACAPLVLSVFGYVLVTSRTFLTRRQKEVTELQRMLGLSFQGQGMLDMAYERFLKCPVEDQSVRDLFYNLGLDFERKRMFNKAQAVYTHLLSAGKFKDISERIFKLRGLEEKVVYAGHSEVKGSTLMLEDVMTLPTLGRYEIIKQIGQGGMGTVYIGRDPTINRDVAIKTLKYENIDECRLPEIKKRFFHEAEAAGKLTHPNIVTIYDVGEEHDMAYIAMELIDGEDLSGSCRRRKTMSVRRTLEVVACVAEALAYAHSHGVVHRDIKPANIIFVKTGGIKVADFGIAQFMSSTRTQTGIIYGTPSYMSPEQAAGKKVDGRSDLFSLGIVFYELLTGRKPFDGDHIQDVLNAIIRGEYVPPKKVRRDIPPCCDQIIQGLLARSAAKRIQSAEKLLVQLRKSQKRVGS